MDILEIILQHLKELGFVNAREFDLPTATAGWINGWNLYQIRVWDNGIWDKIVVKNLWDQITTIARTYGSEFKPTELSVIIPSLSIPNWDTQEFIDLHSPESLERLTKIINRRTSRLPWNT